MTPEELARAKQEAGEPSDATRAEKHGGLSKEWGALSQELRRQPQGDQSIGSPQEIRANVVSDRANEPPTTAKYATYRPQSREYPALRTIIVVYQVTAILMLLGGIAVAVFTSDVGMLTRIGVLVVAGLIGLFQWASAEVIQVFLDIEANTRSQGG